jgi:hypothetical protein
MKRILGLAAITLFSLGALGQATPVSSTPDQASAPAAQEKSAGHSKTAKVHHTKAHHKGHKKHHKTA